MGQLTYDGTLSAEFDDRVLAHLQMAIGAKLRRGESFHFSFSTERAAFPRTSIWLHPGIPLVYQYVGGRPPSINRDWIDELMASANSVSGLHIMQEPTDSANADG